MHHLLYYYIINLPFIWMSHSAYSPDLVHCDTGMLRIVKESFEDQEFEIENELLSVFVIIAQQYK